MAVRKPVSVVTCTQNANFASFEAAVPTPRLTFDVFTLCFIFTVTYVAITLMRILHYCRKG